MSIQNRLLFVYTSIYVVAFVLFATIVYMLPRNRILSQIDGDLQALATQILTSSLDQRPDGTIRINIPPELNTLQTASTFFVVVDTNGETVLLRSRNLSVLDGFLDPDGFENSPTFNQVYQGDAILRVLTVPITSQDESGQTALRGYLQVARLVDSVESFNRSLVIALFFGFAAAIGSLFLAVLLTPGSFRPLEDIANVARQITNADDLSRRVPDAGRTDEIGVLTRSINQTLERLERLFQTQQRLLADVSHELRTPLTAIRGNIDLMKHMGDGDPESLDIILEEVDRMTRLVGDLLLLARADAGGLPLAKNKVELDSIVFEVYRQLEHIARGKVEVTLTTLDPVCVFGDADRLKQLFLNLGSNAVKYTPEKGHVRLSLTQSDGWAYVKVVDTGNGIPAEDLPYIFDRFYRVDKARARIQGGTGLGLSIAKWIATAHDGDIGVSSAVGEGSTFVVSLPAYIRETAVSDAVPHHAESVRNGNGRSIVSPFWRRRDEIKAESNDADSA